MQKNVKIIRKEKKSRKHFFVIPVLIVGVIFTVCGIKFKDSKNVFFSYSANKKDNYEIILKDNNLYNENILPQDSYYASKSIKNCILNFVYDFKANNTVNIDYSYDITAQLVGSFNIAEEKKDIWNKEFILLNKVENSCKNTSDFSIDENVKLDYSYYRKLVELYKDTYEINIDAVLKVRLNVYYNLENLEVENERVEDYIELDIPITNTITNIEENYEKNLYKEIGRNNNFGNICIIIGGAFILLGAIILLAYLLDRLNLKTVEEKYNKKIKDIENYYRELLVDIKSMPNLDGLNVIEVLSLNDLINLAQQSKKCILHYKVEGKYESKLYVLIEDNVYTYKIKA